MSDKYIIDAAYQKCVTSNELNDKDAKVLESSDMFEVSANACKFVLQTTRSIVSNRIDFKFLWLTKKQKSMQITNDIIHALMNYFCDGLYREKILGFTEMEKDGISFRADIDYRGKGPWYDNVLVHWESSSTLIPAELKMFFKFETETKYYAVIHSCHERCSKHSVLSNIWIKEYQNDSKESIRRILPYLKDNTCEDKNPLLRIIPCEAIHSHCLLMPLNDCSQQCIQISCPTTWADEFFPLE